MIMAIGEDFGCVFGGKRGFLSTKELVSQPLRFDAILLKTNQGITRQQE